MKRIMVFGLVVAMLATFLTSATSFGTAQVQAAAPQTYQVKVGYENAKIGATIQAFFPDTVTIHVGDSVHWVIGSHEIHTVTFLAPNQAPPEIIMPSGSPISPLQMNPQVVLPNRPANGLYAGNSFANSGLMSLDAGSVTSFDLTFTQVGSYTYICLVHGATMSGKVVVVPPAQGVATPAQSAARGQAQMARAVSKIGDAIEMAASMVPAPSRNSDGSKTYHVVIGYSDGQIDLMRFFPSHLNVRPGDTVVWEYGTGMSGMSMAPHTVTFLNGMQDPTLTLPNSFLINPLVLFPSAVTNPPQAGQPLTRNGFYNSGLLTPGGSFSLKIGAIQGKIDYECLLHDPSGMVASLNVLPR